MFKISHLFISFSSIFELYLGFCLLIVKLPHYSLHRDCRVVKDSASGKSKGYGFVSFLKKEVCFVNPLNPIIPRAKHPYFTPSLVQVQPCDILHQLISKAAKMKQI